MNGPQWPGGGRTGRRAGARGRQQVGGGRAAEPCGSPRGGVVCTQMPKGPKVCEPKLLQLVECGASKTRV